MIIVLVLSRLDYSRLREYKYGLFGVMMALNLVVSARLHEYYRVLFPLAGFFAPVGLFLIIQGASTEDMRSGVVPRSLIRLMLAAMIAGAALGLYANHVRFGRAF